MGHKTIGEIKRAVDVLVDQGLASSEVTEGERWCNLCYQTAQNRAAAAKKAAAKCKKASDTPPAKTPQPQKTRTKLPTTPEHSKPKSGQQHAPKVLCLHAMLQSC